MTPPLPAGLEQPIRQYFDLLYHCDLAIFDTLFATSLQLQTVSEGRHIVIPHASYRQMLADRTPPARSGAARDDRVLHAELNGDDCAWVKVAAAVGPKRFTDYLGLLRIDGRWRIVSKVYTQTA